MANISGIVKTIRTLMRGDKGINGDAQRIEQMAWMLFLKIFDDKDIEMELLEEEYVSPIPSELQWRNWAKNSEGITGDELLNFINMKLFPTLKDLSSANTNKRALLIKEIFEGNNNYMKSGTIIRQVVNKLNEVDFNNSEDKHLFGEIYETILKELQSAGDSGEFYTPRAITEFVTSMVNPKLGEVVFDPACGTGGFLTSAIEHIRCKDVQSIEDRLILQHSIRGVELKPLPHMLALTNLILHDIEVPDIIYDDALSREYTSITQKDKVDCVLANPPFGGNVSDGMETNFPLNYRTKESADLFLIMIIQYLKKFGRAGIVLPDGSLTGDGIKERIRKKLLEDCNLHTIIRLPSSVFQPYANVATNLLFFTKGEPTKEVWYYEHSIPEGQKAYSKTKPIQLKEFNSIKKWWNNREESEYSWKVDINTIIESGYNLDIQNPNKLADVFESPEDILHEQNKLHTSMQRNAKLLISEISNLENISPSMELLTRNFDYFLSDIKNIKFLKSFFLKCAIEGRLTEKWRETNKVEPVSDFLNTNYNINPIDNDKYPFSIPSSWDWYKFGDIVKFNLGKTPPSKDESYWNNAKYNWIAISDMTDYGYVSSTTKKVNEKSKEEIFKYEPIQKNTLIMSFKLTVGRTSILNIDAYHNEAIISIYPHCNEHKMYLFYTLPLFSLLTDKRKAIKGITLNKGKMLNMNISLPPLNEQKEIIRKIEYLFKICDELRTQINTSQINSQELMQSILNEAFIGEENG